MKTNTSRLAFGKS